MSDLLTGQPWAQAPTELVTADISAQAFRLCMAIQLHRRPGGQAPFPSIRRLAEMCHVSPDTIKRSIRELQTAGILRVQARAAVGGRQTSNAYSLSLPVTPSAPVHPPSVTPSAPVHPPSSAPVHPQEVEEEGSRPGFARDGRAQEMVKLYCDTLADRGVHQIPRSHPARVGAEAKRLLGDGIDPDFIAAAIQVVARRGLTPAAIPNLVMDAQAPKQTTGRRYGRGVSAQELLDDMRRNLASAGSEGLGSQLAGSLPTGDA